MPIETGVLLQNRYRIETMLGQGGMGAVYRATDIIFNSPVAIKENLGAGTGAQKQFIREANLLHQLRHPNIPRVTDYFFIPQQGQYLVMDYVDGENLEQTLESHGPLSEKQALACIMPVLEALTYMHHQDIIHRDVKPANIKLTPQGAVFLVDFGLAKVYDPGRKTTEGARAVTPGFAPPEQYGGGRTDARSDVYAVGATLYTLLTDAHLPEALTLVLGAEALTPPRDLNLRISTEMDELVLKALALRPDDRFQSVIEFRSALTAVWSKAEGSSRASDLPTLPVLKPLLPPEKPHPTTARQQQDVENPSSATAPVLSVVAPVRPAQVGPQDVFIQPQKEPTFEPEMVLIPAGSFQVGSNPIQDPESQAEERPHHTLSLPNYYLSRTPVTNAQYRVFVQRADHPAPLNAGWQDDRPPLGKENHPVVMISWHDALAYCRWLTSITGREYRLPTEVEWEKGARGTDGRIYPWGNEWDAQRCNTAERGLNDTSPVGAYPTGDSPYGLADMAGNVLEWTSSLWNKESNAGYSYTPPGQPGKLKLYTYPYLPTDGRENLEAGRTVGRVVRGGCFTRRRTAARSAHRDWSLPGATFAYLGFRVASSQDASD